MDCGGRIRSRKFFRRDVLKVKTHEEYKTLIDGLANERKSIRKQLFDIMWHMRGSISREEAWTLSREERLEIKNYIDDRIKIVKESGLALL